MVPTKAARMLILITAFLITLSVSTNAVDEPRRCYWCGPLAEQVHRSRRAPPCDAAANQITSCESGLTHCAVVATSPPHVESRYCVKLYQEECFPLYCNSTKTWKMTCPCQGNLCNGANTEREIEAFAILDKLVAKTHTSRIKKRTAVSLNTLVMPEKYNQKREVENDNINQIIASEELPEQNYTSVLNISEEFQKDEIRNIVVENYISPPSFDIGVTEKSKDSNIELKNESSQDVNEDSEIQADEPIIESENALKNENIVSNTPTQRTEVDEQIHYSKNDEDTKMPETETTIILSISHGPTESSVKSEGVITESVVKNNIKLREELPTAEALQDNASPTEIIPKVFQDKEKFEDTTSEHTTTAKHISTPTASDVKILSTKPPKSIAVRLFTHYSIIMNCIVMYCFI